MNKTNLSNSIFVGFLIFNTLEVIPSIDLTKDLRLYETIFRELFKPLCVFAMKYTGDWEESRNLVHEVFISVWEKFDTLPTGTQYRSYLFTAVRNRSLNYLRDKKKTVSLEAINGEAYSENNAPVETAELENLIEVAIKTLPEKCRQIFEMNRMDGLKYSEIADKLGISIKTVEAQMSKALQVLREHLSEFLTLVLFIFQS